MKIITAIILILIFSLTSYSQNKKSITLTITHIEKEDSTYEIIARTGYKF